MLTRIDSAIRRDDAPTVIHLTHDLAPHQRTPLIFKAAHCRAVDVALALLPTVPDVNAVVDGETLLHVAAYLALPKPPADVNARGRHGCTPLHVASGPTVTALLMRAPGVDVNALTESGMTPLMCAIPRVVGCPADTLLLSPRLDPNVRGPDGHTALHEAALCGRTQIIASLMSLKTIDPNPTTSSGATPLHFAARDGDAESVRLLLSHPHTDPNIATHSPCARIPCCAGSTPLHVAARDGDPDTLSALASCPRTLLNPIDSEGRTPLHVAASSCGDNTHALVSRGADVNARDAGGHTPLHLAVREYKLKALDILVAAPSMKLRARTRTGLTARRMAQDYAPEIVQKLMMKRKKM